MSPQDHADSWRDAQRDEPRHDTQPPGDPWWFPTHDDRDDVLADLAGEGYQ